MAYLSLTVIAVTPQNILKSGLCLEYRQPVDETGQDMLDMFESLRQSLVGVLEAGARRKAASSEMQAAQAQLARQGVSGITSDGMLSGSVQLVGSSHTYHK